MKIFLLLLLFVPSVYADGWSKTDTTRESVYLGLHVVDWLQTREIARNPDKWHEQNIVLGRHPSTNQINGYFMLTGLAHIAVSRALPAEYRAAWQYVTIGVELGAVVHNYSIGVRIGF